MTYHSNARFLSDILSLTLGVSVDRCFLNSAVLLLFGAAGDQPFKLVGGLIGIFYCHQYLGWLVDIG